jgi:cell division protein FtsI (penicillin-binding protein 3)
MKNLPARRARFMRLRIALLALCLCAGAGAVLRRAYHLQVEEGPKLREMAEEQYLKDIHLSPKRGSIFDRNGAELAVSVDVESVFVNPKRMKRAGVAAGDAARKLSSLLGLDPKTIEERIGADRHFAWIKRRVSPNEAKAVRLLDIPGVGLTAEARRYYPNRELGAHVLGFANIDGQGIDGLELSLDARLRGSSELVPAIRDRRGTVVFSEQLLDDRAAQGDDVVLTLDKTIQHVAERELELTVRTFEAKGGSVVALDPRTGEIYAIANYPTFNPNEPSSADQSHRRNRAITDRFEPGSTIKPFTLAGAFAAGVISADQRIDCEGGALKVAQYTIHDTHQWDELTPAEILQHSSNIGAAKIGMALGRARLYRTLRDFGFGAPTSIGLPGEISGSLRHYKRWYDMDAATIAFGQGVSVTSMQMAAATAVLANHGRAVQPVLVRRIEDAHGEVVDEAVARAGQQVVPAQTAALIADMMTAVTGDEGTGVEAAIDGVLVAGKTGTAQKADYVHGGYAGEKWTSSFVGFAPARKPRLVISVVIDEPMIAHQGGTVAAPAFRRIMEASLRHLGVVPNTPRQVAALRAPQRPAASDPAQAALVSAAAATPAAPEASERALAEDERSVPNLLGQSARAALVTAQAAGVALSLRGTGLVTAQTPSAGAVVRAGEAIEATLAPPREDAASAGAATPAPARKPASPPTPPAAPNKPKLKLAAFAAAEGRDG